ncbi:copper resistance protein CopC [Phenylobacterium sp.]|uniref:copper resistance protein CopC n=1 Tax=Phenylobacterium sp. TaxID=1871053 RepID=UPI0028126A11|nr:copper resistance protein CopC [Phenylobacterium sp.]
MIRTLVVIAALAFAGAAAAQDPHAGHNMQAAAAAPRSGITTVPADGAMTHGSPERFSATFPHPMILKTVTLTAEGQAPVVVAVPAAPAAATVSVALPPLTPNTYTAAWTAEGPDGHRMSGSISFMVH